MLISYIHHTVDCNRRYRVGTDGSVSKSSLFQDSDFAGKLGRLQVFVRLCAVQVQKFFVGSDNVVLRRCVSEVAVLCLLSKLILLFSGMHA